MNYLRIPLEIAPSGLARETDHRQSIDEALHTLITTPLGAAAADPKYGFVFNNFAFENFNESDGTIYSAQNDLDDEENRSFYSKKISGSSKSINTFAAELRHAIADYEPRLADVTVSMTYIRQERNIHIMVRGIVRATKEDYQFSTTLKIWK